MQIGSVLSLLVHRENSRKGSRVVTSGIPLCYQHTKTTTHQQGPPGTVSRVLSNLRIFRRVAAVIRNEQGQILLGAGKIQPCLLNAHACALDGGYLHNHHTQYPRTHPLPPFLGGRWYVSRGGSEPYSFDFRMQDLQCDLRVWMRPRPGEEPLSGGAEYPQQAANNLTSLVPR